MEKEFDENQAVAKMAEAVAPTKSDADELLNIVDIIWDYYEDHGFLSMDCDEPDPDAEVLTAHVVKMLRKDRGAKIAAEDVPALVAAELDYEASLLD